MQVQVKELSTGRIKTMDKKFADILVKLKKHEYHTRVMVAPVKPIKASTDEAPRKKRKRRKKKATYETKVMTAEG